MLVTSYSGLRQHQERLLAQRFDYVILDEGHKIRNPDAEITLACKQVKLTDHGTSEIKHFSQLSRKDFFAFYIRSSGWAGWKNKLMITLHLQCILIKK